MTRGYKLCKEGVIFRLTFTLSLMAMTALTGTSSQSIRVLPGPVEVKQGNDVTLWCELKYDTKGGVPVHWQSPPNFKARTSNCISFIREKYSISCGGGWYNMTVVDVQWADKGKYQCVHTSHTGIVDLQVLVPVTDVSLTHVTNSTADSLSKGNNAELTCSTSCAYPAPKVSWLENDQPFKGSANIITADCTGDKEGQKKTISTATLRGENVDKERKELIMSCEAENVIGEKKFSRAINALAGTSSQSMRVRPGPVEVKQGKNVTLWCELKYDTKNGVPVHWQSPPNFKTRTFNCVSYAEEKYHVSCAENRLRWYNLTIVDVQWSDNGKYRCISANLEVVDLQVLVPVTKVSLTHDQRSKKELLLLGNDSYAVLTCKTNCAHPASNISWFENDQTLSDSAGVTITECAGEKKGQKRTIGTVTVTGRYVGEERKMSNISCTAGNIKGEPNVSRTVNVRYNVPVTNVSLTHVPRSKDELLFLGEDSYAVLTCTTNCAYPTPSISWFENEQSFNGSAEVTITECTGEKKGLKRTISAVTVTGRYILGKRKQSNISCTAGNVKGEPKVSRTVNVGVNSGAVKPPQPAMTRYGTVAAILGAVVVVIIIVVVIIVFVRRNRKKRRDVNEDEEEGHPLLPTMGPFLPRSVIVYEYDCKTANHNDNETFLRTLKENINKEQGIEEQVYMLEVERSEDRTLEETLQLRLQTCQRVVLAFPDDKFVEAIMQLKGEPSSVAIIIRTDQPLALPQDIDQALQILWVPVDILSDVAGVIRELKPFLRDEQTTIDCAFMNSGTGLAWSYYFGYLMNILPDFEKKLRTSTWRESHPEIPKNRISKKLFIVFTTNCRKPKILNSERIKLSKPINKNEMYRAGVLRNYDFKIKEVKSRDGKESVYGVVCFLDIVQVLSEMRSDSKKDFVSLTKYDMQEQGKYCLEKLKLFMKYTYNKKIKIDQSNFDFIEFNTEAENVDEDDLADDLFNRMKETCLSETSNAGEETGLTEATDANQIGILCDPMTRLTRDIIDFLEKLSKVRTTMQVNRIEFGLKLIRVPKRIFMVLTDDFVKSDAFAKWFYTILDKAYRMNNRRFLVCLNCLSSENADHPMVQELQQLFISVSYNETEWADKVTRELDEVRDVINQSPVLKERFENSEMSHKVFFLHPDSCHCPGKVSDADPQITLVDDKDINLPHIKKATRDYTPKLYCINRDGNAYYAFVEFNTQADTMYRMKQEGFLSESILKKEWSRFRNKLHTLITHKDEPMDVKNRTVFIRYDDKNMKEGDLAEILLHHVQYEIAREQRMLPEPIDNGATIEFDDCEKTTSPPSPKAAYVDASACGEEEEDFIETTYVNSDI